jgi:hypothetical protein
VSSFTSYVEWSLDGYKNLPVTVNFSSTTSLPFNLFTVCSASGAYPDPATPDFLLQLLVAADTNIPVTFDLGSGTVEEFPGLSSLYLAPPFTDCDYQVECNFSLILLPFSSAKVAEVLEGTKLNPHDFGKLHDGRFRDPFLSA